MNLRRGGISGESYPVRLFVRNKLSTQGDLTAGNIVYVDRLLFVSTGSGDRDYAEQGRGAPVCGGFRVDKYTYDLNDKQYRALQDSTAIATEMDLLRVPQPSSWTC